MSTLLYNGGNLMLEPELHSTKKSELLEVKLPEIVIRPCCSTSLLKVILNCLSDLLFLMNQAKSTACLSLNVQ